MKESSPNLRILGIDPALRCTGYGLLDTFGSSLKAIDCGVIRTPAKRPVSDCLRRLAGGVAELIKSYSPDVVAIEGGFYSKNAKTAMVLGCARGVVIAGAATAGLEVYEYAPRRVKQAVCGYGNADKEQLSAFLCQLTGLNPDQLMSDATDALGVAFCHNAMFRTNQGLFLPKPI
ncbi:MAG: crossover junction endodeoxyribonuclease RuvC [Lentisphaeria bacterium]|nr:crossover junction endodeoxyribonuclease RuvC [Lentisphaeria bacterium]